MQLRHLLVTLFASLSFVAGFVHAHQPVLRAMTYNIRYDNPADSLDNWQYRREFIANMIQFYAPDVLGIQEGLIHQVRELESSLPEYSWSGRGRDDGKEAGEFAAIFFSKDRFRLLNESTFWLSPTPDSPSKGWDAALNRIVSWVELKVRQSGRTLFVFNTHFDHQGVIAREESARLLIQRIRAIAKGRPSIVIGDFNSTDVESPYRNITAADSSALRLYDTMTLSKLPHHGPLKTYSGFDVHQGVIGERIDFIFVSDKVDVLRHATLSDFMRNEHFPSDHLPVIADLELP